jgi:hypothetical protein
MICNGPRHFSDVAQLAIEILKRSCAKLVAGPKEILRGHQNYNFKKPSWQLLKICQGLSL